MENSPPSQAPYSQVHTGSYPHTCTLPTLLHTAPPPFHTSAEQSTYGTRVPAPQGPRSLHTHAHHTHPTLQSQVRPHTHLSHIHAYTHIYLTAAITPTRHTPRISCHTHSPSHSHMHSVSHTHRNRHAPSLTPACMPRFTHVHTRMHTHSYQLSALSHQPADQCSGQALSLPRRAPHQLRGAPLHSAKSEQGVNPPAPTTPWLPGNPDLPPESILSLLWGDCCCCVSVTVYGVGTGPENPR